MAGKPILFDALFQDDLERVKIGRFNEAEERMMEQVIQGRAASLWRVFGRGRYYVDMRAPGVYSTRPMTAEKGQTFTFSHRTVSKRHRKELRLGERLYLRVDGGADGAALRAAGATFDGCVSVGGKRGGWWVPPGAVAPRGTTFARTSEIVPEATGEAPGTAARRQRYIERDGAVEDAGGEPVSVGNIAADADARERFWDAVERRERADGRVQAVIIAELPYEPQVGAAGRRRIVERFGEVLAGLGLRWHGTVHKPDEHSDPRNFHMHLVYSERPAEETGWGWTFAAAKAPETRARGFVRDLRERYAEAVNEVLADAGIERRLDPRTYEEMGIVKHPGEHLGVAAAALERKGVATVKGRRNLAREWMFRIARQVMSSHDGVAADVRRLDAAAEALDRAEGAMSPRVTAAARRLDEAAEQFGLAAEEHRRREAHAALAGFRADDVLRRPATTAVYNDDPVIRAEAAVVAGDLRTWGRETRRQAVEALTAARRRRAAAERMFGEAERDLAGETVLAERATVMAGIERTVARLVDGRASERRWRRVGADLVVRREAAEAGRAAAAARLEAALAPLGEGAAGAAKRLLNERARGRALKEIGLDPSLTAGEVARADEASAAVLRADLEIAVCDGETRRRRRIEADAELRRKRLRSDAEDRELLATLRELRREISLIDRRIIADPSLLRKAETEGLANRIGREGARLVETVRRRTQQERGS